MKLTVNPTATKQELVNTALDFSKYGTDAEAMEFLNDVLYELKWVMSANEFQEFNCRINDLIIEGNKN